MNYEYGCTKCKHNLIFTDRELPVPVPCDTDGCDGSFVLRARYGWDGSGDKGRRVSDRFTAGGDLIVPDGVRTSTAKPKTDEWVDPMMNLAAELEAAAV